MEGVTLGGVCLLGHNSCRQDWRVILGAFPILAAPISCSWKVWDADPALTSWTDQSQGRTVWVLGRGSPTARFLPVVIFSIATFNRAIHSFIHSFI